MHDALRMDHDLDTIIRQPEQKVRLDYLERLVRQSRAVDRDLSPHSPGWMPEGILDGGGSEALATPVSEWSARGGEDNTPHLRGWMPGDALQDRAVLAIAGDHFAAPRRARLAHQVPGNDKRLLVRERDTLPLLQSGKRRIEPGGADDRIEHDIDVIARRRGNERVSPAFPRVVGIGARLDHPHKRRREPPGLLLEQGAVAVGCERGDAKALALPVQHSQRGRSDRACRAKHRHAFRFGGGFGRHCGTGSSKRPSSSIAIGITNSRLSNRSSIPPCPGRIRELSFTPASRFSSDSARSPVCAATLTTMAKSTAP